MLSSGDRSQAKIRHHSKFDSSRKKSNFGRILDVIDVVTASLDPELFLRHGGGSMPVGDNAENPSGNFSEMSENHCNQDHLQVTTQMTFVPKSRS